MKIIGFSAGVVGRDSNVDRMVKAIMERTGYESEFVKLSDLNYSACKGCVWLCAGPQVCQLEDDLFPYYQKVKEADAVVLGSPIHMATVSATMLSLISRLWGYRHVNIPIQTKPFVLALCGAGDKRRDTSEEDFRRALRPYAVSIVDVVSYYSRIPPCYRCGRHQECVIGGAYQIWGDEARTLTITPELFRRWEDRPETVAQIEAAAEKLQMYQTRRHSGALSIDSTLGEILADEKGKAVLEKHVPGLSSAPRTELAKVYPLKAIASMPRGAMTDETLKAIAEDLGKI